MGSVGRKSRQVDAARFGGILTVLKTRQSASGPGVVDA
jgi:hypothetical protein